MLFQNGRVIWKEGIFLQPQHFQAFERYLQSSFDSRLSIENQFCFGITELKIDENALTNGTLVLERCSGVFPDGTICSIPNDHPTPQSRSVSGHFGYDRQDLGIHLGVAVVKEGRSSVFQTGTDNPSRYSVFTAKITDEVTGTEKKEIELGKLNFKLFFEEEPFDGYSTLQIGVLRRGAGGVIELKREFVAPLLKIGASEFIMTCLRNLLEILYAKSDMLSDKRSVSRSGLARFTPGDETSFRLLQTLNSVIPLLNYYYSNGMVHPFELYKTLIFLSGSLSAFSSEITLKDFPLYSHNNIWLSLNRLIEMIRSVLDSSSSSGCIILSFEETEPSVYNCQINDRRIFFDARFFLGLSADVPDKELIVGSLQRIKMSSKEGLNLLIQSAMPGLPLFHLPDPPESIPGKPGFLYFGLDQQNSIWDEVRNSGSMAFYFPHNYKNLKIELFAIREQV